MIVQQRRVYCGTLLLWVLSIVLFPTWIGQLYSRDATGRWYQSGAFGLYGADGWYKTSPLWKPPQAHCDIMGLSVPLDSPVPDPKAPALDPNTPESDPVKVCWPFQTIEAGPIFPNGARVIELSWFPNATRLSLGIIVLGMLVGVWNWWTGPKERDPVIAIAWSLSLWQVIAWPCMVFSGAWMVSEQLAAAVLGGGLLAGILFWVWSQRVRGVSTSSIRDRKS